MYRNKAKTFFNLAKNQPIFHMKNIFMLKKPSNFSFFNLFKNFVNFNGKILQGPFILNLDHPYNKAVKPFVDLNAIKSGVIKLKPIKTALKQKVFLSGNDFYHDHYHFRNVLLNGENEIVIYTEHAPSKQRFPNSSGVGPNNVLELSSDEPLSIYPVIYYNEGHVTIPDGKLVRLYWQDILQKDLDLKNAPNLADNYVKAINDLLKNVLPESSLRA